MVFSLRQIPPNLSLSVAGVTIFPSPSARLLGIWFDSRLVWTTHIGHLLTKCTLRLNLLKRVSGYNWGADRPTLIRLYKALIRSILDFSCIVYSSASASQLIRLDKIQNLALRIATGLPKGSPSLATGVLCGIPPLAIRRQELSLRYLSSRLPRADQFFSHINCPEPLRFYTTWPRGAPPALGPLVQQVLACSSTSPQTLPLSPPWKISVVGPVIVDSRKEFKRPLTPLLAPRIFWSWRATFPPTALTIYTDGAKVPNKYVRAGFFCPELNVLKSVDLPEPTSIFAAEAIGIIMALEFVVASPLPSVLILTDSQSVVEAVRTFDPYCFSIITDLVRVTSELILSGMDVLLAWIPSHVAIKGNERIDEFLRSPGSSHEKFLCPPSAPPSVDIVRQFILFRWSIIWKEASVGRSLYSVYPSVRLTPLIFNATREIDVGMCRMLTDRLRTPEILHRWGVSPSPSCPFCGGFGTLEHLLVSCPGLVAHRQPLRIVLRSAKLAFSFQHCLGLDFPPELLPELSVVLFQFFQALALV